MIERNYIWVRCKEKEKKERLGKEVAVEKKEKRIRMIERN